MFSPGAEQPVEELGTSRNRGVAGRIKPKRAGSGLVPRVAPCLQHWGCSGSPSLWGDVGVPLSLFPSS